MLKTKSKTASSNAAAAPSPLGDSSKDNLGVFATQGIRKRRAGLAEQVHFRGPRTLLQAETAAITASCNKRLLRDRPLWSLQPGLVRQWPRRQLLQRPAFAVKKNAYHKVLCGKEFSEVYQSCPGADVESGNPLATMKVLATAVQQEVKPLKVPCIAALKTGYEHRISSPFSLQENIIAPAQILQTLGADLFTDARFDSWALQTLFSRIENNRQQSANLAGSLDVGIDPLFSIFNHDRDPAATRSDARDGRIGGPIQASSRAAGYRRRRGDMRLVRHDIAI